VFAQKRRRERISLQPTMVKPMLKRSIIADVRWFMQSG